MGRISEPRVPEKLKLGGAHCAVLLSYPALALNIKIGLLIIGLKFLCEKGHVLPQIVVIRVCRKYMIRAFGVSLNKCSDLYR